MTALSPSLLAEVAPATLEHPVILFDGVCNFCNGTVNFLMDRDPERRLKFAALQSEAGARLLRQFEIAGDPLETLVLIEAGKAHVRSSAVLRAMAYLPGPWSLASWLGIVPRFLRDPIYMWVARNRYRWFGKRDSCRMPTAQDRDRFLT